MTLKCLIFHHLPPRPRYYPGSKICLTDDTMARQNAVSQEHKFAAVWRPKGAVVVTVS